MHFMCWEMDIARRTNDHLVDADYWSCLAKGLCFDLLLREYIQNAASIRLNNPVPERMPMLAENMLGARGPRLPRSVDPGNIATVGTIDVHAQSLFASIYVDESDDHEFLTNVPLQYGTFTNRVPLDKTNITPLYNINLTAVAKTITRCEWAIYSIRMVILYPLLQLRTFHFMLLL